MKIYSEVSLSPRAFAGWRHLTTTIVFSILAFVKNHSCVKLIYITKIAVKCILVVVVKWRHHALVKCPKIPLNFLVIILKKKSANTLYLFLTLTWTSLHKGRSYERPTKLERSWERSCKIVQLNRKTWRRRWRRKTQRSTNSRPSSSLMTRAQRSTQNR